MPLLGGIFVIVTAVLMTWPIQLSPYLAIGAVAIVGCWQRYFLIRVFSTIVVATACVSVHLTWSESFTLSRHDEMRALTIIGRVSELPERTEFGQRFHFLLENFDGRTLPWWQSATVVLSCYQVSCEVQAGERWQLTVKLKRPHGVVNFYGFDYEQYLFAHHIRATGSVVNNAAISRLQSATGLAHFRQHHYQQLQQTGLPYINVIAGLSMGADDEIAASIWNDLRRTGTTHLIAISGMHIVLIAALASALAGWLWRRARQWPLRLATPYVQAMAAVLSAIAYAAFAGFSVPTVRALLMTLLLAVLLTRRRVWPPLTVLSIVAVLMLMVDPCSILLPGFCLSFAAVVILLWLAQRRHCASRWRQLIQTQLYLTVGLMPLTLLLFDQVSLVSAVVNLWAVPWVSFICTPLALLGVASIAIAPVLSHSLLWLADQSVHGFVLVNHFFAQSDWAIWQPPHFTWQQHLIILSLVVMLLLPSSFCLRKWTVPLFLLLLFDALFPSRPYAAITILDVGQGLASTIETSQHISVYDAGPSSAKFNAGRDVIAPHIRALGFSRIDNVIISHADNDHAGGAMALREQFAIAQWSVGEKLSALDAPYCRDGQVFDRESVRVAVLSPTQYMNRTQQGNDASCVVTLRVANTTFLFTGDIEKKVEADLTKRYASALAADVLIVPHHGSRTSSTAAFIDAVTPTLAVVSAGYHNRFGHPKADVLHRYQMRQIDVINTADTGAIRWEWDDANAAPRIRLARQTPRRWREPLRFPRDNAN